MFLKFLFSQLHVYLYSDVHAVVVWLFWLTHSNLTPFNIKSVLLIATEWMNCRLFIQHVSSFFMLYWVLTELWILEKFLKFARQFSDVKKSRNYRWSLENGKKSWGFFFSKLRQVLYKWNFLFNLVNSNSISTVRLQCIVKKGLFLQFLRSLLITYLMTLIVENQIIVLEKSLEKSWILDPKICTNTEHSPTI